jgi:hypothetical protein
VRLAVLAYLLAGVLLLFTSWPGQLAALLALPYAAVCAPFWSIADVDAERANRGWRKFLALNFITGFFVTMLLIGYAFVTA